LFVQRAAGKARFMVSIPGNLGFSGFMVETVQEAAKPHLING
jgi:hypothetical protein